MMKWNLWTVVVVVVVAYFIGVKFPTTGQTILAKIGA